MNATRFVGPIIVVFVALGGGCQKRGAEPAPDAKPARPVLASTAPAPAARVLLARRDTPIVNGELDQPVWHRAERTDAFVNADGRRPVPYTEARASWDEDALYLELYVADDDLRASDHVRIDFAGGASVEASPDRELRCHFSGAESCGALGVQAGFDVDGDVDGDAAEDEEWAVTIALPWRALAPEGRPDALAVSLGRDDSSDGKPVREVWSRGQGVIRLE